LLFQRTPVRYAVATAILLALAYVFVRFLKAEEASQELTTAVEQSRAEAAQARQLQERYATLLDSSHDGIVLVEADGRISFANEALTRSLGFSRADLLERHASWLGIQDHSQLVSQPAAGVGSQGSIAFRTVVVEDAAGVRRQAELVIARTEVEGRACLLVVVRDLTAHNLLVDKLERTERSFRAIFSGAPAALITFSADLEVLDRNLRAEDLLAIDALGRDSLEAAFPEGEPLQQFLQQVAETVATRSEQGAVHLTRLRGGSSHRVHWTTSILGTAPGEVPVLMAVAKDLRVEEAAEARLRELRRRAAGAEESERSRIAREIHDDISQRLAATTLNAATIRAQVPAGLHSDIAAMVDGLHGDLDSLTADVHALSRQLHPTALDDLGLVRALQSECARRSGAADLQIQFHGEPIGFDLPGDVALAFFRVGQEAISNAIRHGRPERIDVRLNLIGDRLRLVVSDDGEGFQNEEGDPTGGLGLVSMDERARLIGATLRLEAAPGEGVEVTMEVAVDVAERGPLAG
ncbi:MAG: PAS domain S-box protein, partial [Planctomycetota bacterium]